MLSCSEPFRDVETATMFNPAAVLTAVFGDHLAETYLQAFPGQKPHYADFLNSFARETLEKIKDSNAPYHNADHTMLVTVVGQQVLLGQQKTSAVDPEDWLHFIIACLLHDIGYLNGVCDGDTLTEVVIDDAGTLVCPPRGATDAYLAPYHIERGKMYAQRRFADAEFVDADRIARAIEGTRFPVPDGPSHLDCECEPGLMRAADLIGQTADPYYLSKLSGLYYEFLETGLAEELGCSSPMDLVEYFPAFFHEQVEPWIGPALEHLKQTADGKDLVDQLYNRVSQAARDDSWLGPFAGCPDRHNPDVGG